MQYEDEVVGVCLTCVCPPAGLLGSDLHGVRRQSDLPSGGPGGRPLYVPGSCGWRLPGEAPLRQTLPHIPPSERPACLTPPCPHSDQGSAWVNGAVQTLRGASHSWGLQLSVQGPVGVLVPLRKKGDRVGVFPAA